MMKHSKPRKKVVLVYTPFGFLTPEGYKDFVTRLKAVKARKDAKKNGTQ